MYFLNIILSLIAWKVTNNVTINSVTANEYSTASFIELTGISYTTTYTFSGIYVEDVSLGKFEIAHALYRICIDTEK